MKTKAFLFTCFVFSLFAVKSQTFKEYKKREKAKFNQYVENEKKMFEAFVINELDWNKAILGYEVNTPISEKIDSAQAKSLKPKLTTPAYVDNSSSLDKEIEQITVRVVATVADKNNATIKENEIAAQKAKEIEEVKRAQEKTKEVTAASKASTEKPNKKEKERTTADQSIKSTSNGKDEYVQSLIEKEKHSIPSIVPVKSGYTISSKFGNRFHPRLLRWRFHGGVDLASPRGTAIRSTANGVVVKSGSNGNYGNYILIKHGNGYQTAYAHLNKIDVKAGTKVQQGQVIGEVGSTGSSTGNHLHYEVIKNSKRVNPEYFFGS